MKKGLKVLIGGAPFGDTNYGEDAILSADVAMLRSIDPDIDITVLTSEPERTNTWLNVKAFPMGSGKRNPRFIQHLNLMSQTDVFAFGGTTMLSDGPNLPLRLILLAKLMGKPVITFPCGMNPIPSKTTRLAMKHLLRRVDLLIVRDEETKHLLVEYGVDIPIHIAADQVFTLKPIDNELEIERLLTENSFLMGPIPVAAISLTHTGSVPLGELVKLSNYLIDGLGYSILFFPTQANDRCDMTFSVMEQVSNRERCFTLKRRYLPEEVLAMLGYVDFAISSRLHLMISCAIANVPSIVLSRSQKIDNFIKIMNHESAGSIDKITFQQTKEKVDYLHKNLIYEKQQLAQKMIPVKMSAMISNRLICDFLDSV